MYWQLYFVYQIYKRKKKSNEFDPITSGALAFAAVLILMAFNIPIGISMLDSWFTGFGFIVGFEQAFFILGTAPYEAVSKYSLSVLPFFVLMGNLANRANLSRNFYDAAYAIVGHYKWVALRCQQLVRVQVLE